MRNFDEEYRAEEATYACARTHKAVLVTGAAGFVGSYLVRALLRQGRTVRAMIYRGDKTGLEDLEGQLTFIEADITDKQAVDAAVAGVDVVYHLASLVSLRARDLPLLEKVNVGGTQNVVDACIKHGVKKLMHFGSIHALNAFPDHQPITEERSLADAGTDPDIAPYDLTKARAEQRVIEARGKLDAVRITPVGIWGPGDRLPSLLGRYLLQLWDRRLPCLPIGGFYFVDVRDVVHGCMAAEERGMPGSRYLFKGHYVQMPTLSRMVYDVTGESRCVRALRARARTPRPAARRTPAPPRVPLARAPNARPRRARLTRAPTRHPARSPWTPSIPMWVALVSAEVCKHFNGDELGFNPSCIRPIRYYQQVRERVPRARRAAEQPSRRAAMLPRAL